jgi:hypothetical protein
MRKFLLNELPRSGTSACVMRSCGGLGIGFYCVTGKKVTHRFIDLPLKVLLSLEKHATGPHFVLEQYKMSGRIQFGTPFY